VVSFAGGAFFVSYQKRDDSKNAYLAVSFDGENFSLGVNAFPSVPQPTSVEPGPVGGVVAYDPEQKIYVTCGSYDYHYDFLYDADGDGSLTTPNHAVEQNFMWSTSIDGLHWTPGFDTSGATSAWTGSGGILAGAIGAGAAAQTVAFGNGVFVAATWVKWRYPDNSDDPRLAFLNILAGFATSVNGKTWTNHRLPDTLQDYPSFDSHLNVIDSASNCVKYYKTSVDGGKGFFVIGVNETQFGLGPEGIINPVHNQKIYKSEDGFSWTVVRSTSIPGTNLADQTPWVLSSVNKNFDPEKSEIVHV